MPCNAAPRGGGPTRRETCDDLLAALPKRSTMTRRIQRIHRHEGNLNKYMADKSIALCATL